MPPKRKSSNKKKKGSQGDSSKQEEEVQQFEEQQEDTPAQEMAEPEAVKEVVKPTSWNDVPIYAGGAGELASFKRIVSLKLKAAGLGGALTGDKLPELCEEQAYGLVASRIDADIYEALDLGAVGTAKEVLEKLELAYSKVNSAGRVKLLKELLGLKQKHDESMTAFVARSRALYKRTIEAKVSLDDMLIVSVLAGLKGGYETLAAMLEAEPDLTYDEMRARLLSYEATLHAQQGDDSKAAMREVPAFWAGGSNKGGKGGKGDKCHACGAIGHIKKFCPTLQRRDPNAIGTLCGYCGEPGHFIKDCPMMAAVNRNLVAEMMGKASPLPQPGQQKQQSTTSYYAAADRFCPTVARF